MGHERVGFLPRTKEWRQLVHQIADSAATPIGVPALAAATLPAQELTWTYDSTPIGKMNVVVLLPVRRADQKLPVLLTMHGRGEAMKGPERGARGWVDDYELSHVIQRLAKPPLTRDDFKSFVKGERLARLNAALLEHPYRGMVIVCPYTPDMLTGDDPFGKAPPLADYVAPFTRYFRDFDFSLIRRDHARGSDGYWDVNWKIGFESGIEDYHLPWVHPELFERPVPWQGRGFVDGMMIGTEDEISSEHRSSIVDIEKDALPVFPDLPEDAAWRGNFMMIFPNVGFTVLADHFDSFIMLPETPTRSWLRSALYFVGDEALAPRFEATRQKVREAWDLIGAQDLPIAARVQANLFARDAAGIPNRFSPVWENAIQRFQQLVVESIDA